MEVSKKKVLVPRLMDKSNFNAQNLNAKELLKRFRSSLINWETVAYSEPIKEVMDRDNNNVTKLLKGRCWPFSLLSFYQKSADAIFYPGKEWFDVAGLNLRKNIRKYIPVISTIEGIMGDEHRDKYLSEYFGHPVYTNKVIPERMRRFDQMYKLSTHVISISPFLGKIVSKLYEKNVTVLPLGVDLKIFNPKNRKLNNRKQFRIITVGTVYERKRPYLFLKVAEQFPDTEFVWYGDGILRRELCDHIKIKNIENVKFAGLRSQASLANEFRESDLLIVTSDSEGVPKVTQEAAACGLPVILFGYYEAPSVIDGQNGYVVWDDNEMIERVSSLLESPDLLAKMGDCGVAMSREWSWDVVAPQWEETILRIISTGN